MWNICGKLVEWTKFQLLNGKNAIFTSIFHILVNFTFLAQMTHFSRFFRKIDLTFLLFMLFRKRPNNMKGSWLLGHSKQVSFILYGFFPKFSRYIDRFDVKIALGVANKVFSPKEHILTVNRLMYREKFRETPNNMKESCLLGHS